jgi:hypothetical protein
MKNFPLALIFALPYFLFAQTGSSSLISINSNGKLEYTSDSHGNIIPDYSYVGYKNGDSVIPLVPVVKTITAVVGDNLSSIQNAINIVAALPLINGLRGAILLKAGNYYISDTVKIKASGIVLRGEGNSTILHATKTSKYDLIQIQGSSSLLANTASSKKIQGTYLPVGVRSFDVASGHTFVVGDDVLLQRKPKTSWITLIGMDTLTNIDPTAKNWTTSLYTMNYRRKIIAVNGNTISVDAPVVEAIDATYADGYLMKYTWTGKIENIGIENMYIDSDYNGAQDENHGWDAITFDNMQNGWVQNVEAHHFGYSTVNIFRNAHFVSVINCKNIDPISISTGGRKYSFMIGGQRCLVKNCYSKGGRHDFVLGSRAAGPNVFIDGVSDNQLDHSGPHNNWAVGTLLENIVSTNEMDAENRLDFGGGNGWAGAQTMFWNCVADTFKVQNPPGSINWVIGCTGVVTNKGTKVLGLPGVYESTGNAISFSLYNQQLCERMGTCLSTKINELNDEDVLLSVYPNPFSNEVCVGVVGMEKILVFDAQGKEVLNTITQNPKLDLSSLNQGVYLLQVVTREGIQSVKLIKN